MLNTSTKHCDPQKPRFNLDVVPLIWKMPVFTNSSSSLGAHLSILYKKFLSRFSTVENLFKYSEIFKGRAATKGQVLGSIPDNSKFIEIIGLNYADDNNFYYFTPIVLRTEIVRNKDVAIAVGITSDVREFILSFKNNVITITYSAVPNSSGNNNFIGQILSVNA